MFKPLGPDCVDILSSIDTEDWEDEILQVPEVPSGVRLLCLLEVEKVIEWLDPELFGWLLWMYSENLPLYEGGAVETEVRSDLDED
jgi:hypothetical protein